MSSEDPGDLPLSLARILKLAASSVVNALRADKDEIIKRSARTVSFGKCAKYIFCATFTPGRTLQAVMHSAEKHSHLIGKPHIESNLPWIQDCERRSRVEANLLCGEVYPSGIPDVSLLERNDTAALAVNPVRKFYLDSGSTRAIVCKEELSNRDSSQIYNDPTALKI